MKRAVFYAAGRMLGGASLLCVAGFGHAQEAASDDSHTVMPVEVKATRDAATFGKTTVSEGQVERLDDGSGDLNRLLRNLPNVQYGEDLNDAYDLGEIKPSDISISGGRFYENHFSLDGVSTNSMLDPGGQVATNSVNDVPGYAQSQFIDPSLIGELEVFDANVPARVGGFTGGAVLAHTRAPSSRRRFSAFFSGTDDSMKHFIFVPQSSDPVNGQETEVRGEPEYRKLRYGFTADQPVGENSALMLSLSRLESTIPVTSLARAETQRRTNTNMLLKGRTLLGASDVTWSANYTPYEANNLIEDVRGSDFTLTGGGFGTQMDVFTDTAWGLLNSKVYFSHSENNREAPKDFYNWMTSSSGPDWGERIYSLNSREGGFGDLDKTQREMGTRLRLLRQQWGGELDLGMSFNALRAEYERAADAYVFGSGKIDDRTRCVGGDVSACIERNQALYSRNVYPEDSAVADLHELGLYGEWTLDRRRWGLRLGLRADVDDFQENLNVAPRTLFYYRPAPRVSLSLGANRYYSRSLLAYKLREARKPYYTEYREAQGGTVGGEPVVLVGDNWQSTAAAGDLIYRGSVSDLETPYSDEVSTGVAFPLLGGTLGLRGLYREYHDEFAQDRSAPDPDTGFVTLSPNNAGEGEYRSLVLGWSRTVWDTDIGLNVTWSETKRSNSSYDARSSSAYQDQQVIYKGDLVRLGELDVVSDNFARPVVANLTLSREVLPRFRVSLTGRYRDAYDNLEDTGRQEGRFVQECPGCESTLQGVPVYGSVERPSTVLFDAKLAYSHRLASRQWLDFELILDNVFDQRTHTATVTRPYESGIGAWALVRYRYGEEGR